jgi:PilZ domain
MARRPQERYKVDFQIFLSWEQKNGTILRIPGRCLDLSAIGAKLAATDRIDERSTVLVHSDQFGRMGNATVRYCFRNGMKYAIGLEFCSVFSITDPARRKILEKVLRQNPVTAA